MRLTLLVSVMSLVLLGAQRAQQKPQLSTSKPQNSQTDGKPAAQTLPVGQASGTPKADERSKDSRNKPDNRPLGEKIIIAATVVIAFAAVAQVIAAIMQYCAMKKQVTYMRDGVEVARRSADAARSGADAALTSAAVARDGVSAAQTGADAALLNARAVINSERPWLVPKLWGEEKTIPSVGQDSTGQPNESRVIYFTLLFENAGKTPARIISEVSRHEYLPWGQEPSIPPVIIGELVHKPILAPGPDKWQPETCSWYINSTNPTVEQKRILVRQQWFWWYGVVKYVNLVDLSEHYTRFCYLYSQPLGEMIASGPAGWNETT